MMLSTPSYDPNQIAANWDYLNADVENSPLLNRATQGSYAPGSTFKIVTTLEYMREYPDYANYMYECGGAITVEIQRSIVSIIRCMDWKTFEVRLQIPVTLLCKYRIDVG